MAVSHVPTAARQLRMSAPAVTRALASLETHLGTRLLTRTTRTVALSSITGDGTLRITLAAGTASDHAGNVCR